MTSDNIDFEALRAKRNADALAWQKKFAEEAGIPLENLKISSNPNRCYCACTTGGPCEHKWDGEWWTSEDECCQSVTCSRCGMTAMSHSLRTGP